MGKNPLFRHFWRKWPFFGIFPKKGPVATGPKTRQMAKNGHFPENR